MTRLFQFPTAVQRLFILHSPFLSQFAFPFDWFSFLPSFFPSTFPSDVASLVIPQRIYILYLYIYTYRYKHIYIQIHAIHIYHVSLGVCVCVCVCMCVSVGAVGYTNTGKRGMRSAQGDTQQDLQEPLYIVSIQIKRTQLNNVTHRSAPLPPPLHLPVPTIQCYHHRYL